MIKYYIVLFVISAFVTSCTQVAKKRGDLNSKSSAMRVVSEIDASKLIDDMGMEGMAEALKANIQHLKSKPNHTLHFAEVIVSSLEYVESLEKLYNVLLNDPEKFNSYLANHFDMYEVYGKDNWGEAFITSYYAPEIKGSLKKTKQFSQALYSLPDDMVIVRLDEFGKAFGKRLGNRFCVDKNDCNLKCDKLGILRARVVEKKGQANEIVPYFSRKEIDKDKVKIPAKVLAWVEPIESFFLQIQGSGTVVLPGNKKLKVGYAGQNGHGYQAIGKYLFDVIPKEKMSLQTIEAHLKTLSDDDLQDLLNKNPSYVFFKQNESKPFTYFGIETIDGRTIATDKRYFPKGSLGFLQFEKPVFSGPEATVPTSWQPASRFVFDHDTGGAIKGGGRLDLFWGAGAEAKQAAGVMKQMGKLYYFKPKAIKAKINLN